MKIEGASRFPLMSTEEQLELVYWLIERNEERRASIANRAAIIVSANSILMAGATFTISQVFQRNVQYSPVEQGLIVVSASATAILLTLSIFNATNGIASVWKLSREVGGLDAAFQRLFIHAYDTVETLESFEEYNREFKSTNQNQMLEYALGYLWAFQRIFYKRYETLRKAIKIFLLSTIVYLITLIMLVVFS